MMFVLVEPFSGGPVIIAIEVSDADFEPEGDVDLGGQLTRKFTQMPHDVSPKLHLIIFDCGDRDKSRRVAVPEFDSGIGPKLCVILLGKEVNNA